MSSFEISVLPVEFILMTGEGTLSENDVGWVDNDGEGLLLFDTTAAIPPPRTAPAVKTAACIMAALGISLIGKQVSYSRLNSSMTNLVITYKCLRMRMGVDFFRITT